jgi:hypothetical protein
VDEFGRRIREEDRRRKKGLLTTYKFKVCDSLVNVGPITDFAIGESFDPASVSMAVRPPLPHMRVQRCAVLRVRVPVRRCVLRSCDICVARVVALWMNVRSKRASEASRS